MAAAPVDILMTGAIPTEEPDAFDRRFTVSVLLGGRTVGLVGMGQLVFDNLDAWFAGRPPSTPVAR